jgi:hypothetical protein
VEMVDGQRFEDTLAQLDNELLEGAEVAMLHATESCEAVRLI